MQTFLQDVRYAVRMLLKTRGFTLVAVLSLALGIGANTAIFTVINAVFLHPLAIEEPSRVAELFTRDTRTVQTGNFNLTPTSLQNFEDYREQNTVFSTLAGYFPFGLQWAHEDQVEGLPAMMTSANYFETLGIRPFRGRFFTPAEDTKTAATVAVLSHSLWRRSLDPIRSWSARRSRSTACRFQSSASRRRDSRARRRSRAATGSGCRSACATS